METHHPHIQKQENRENEEAMRSDPRKRCSVKRRDMVCYVLLAFLTGAVGCEMARSSVSFGGADGTDAARVDTRIDDADGCFSLTKNSAQATTGDPWRTK